GGDGDVGCGGTAAGEEGEGKTRVEASDLVGWIDRVMRINFGFGRKSSPEKFSTPSKTDNSSGEEQVDDISPTTLEADAILTKVKKIKSVDKGKRYKKMKSSKESASTGWDFEEVKSAFEEVNTGGIKVSAGIEEINAGSLDVNTGSDPVATDSIRVSVPSPGRGRREGKAPMIEKEETQASKKTKEQILQEEAGLAEAIRLDQELTEEQKKRKAQVQFEAQSYTEEDWDTIRAKLEANAELRESVLGKDLTVDDYGGIGTWKLTQLKKLNFEEVKAEFENLVKHWIPISYPGGIVMKRKHGMIKLEDMNSKKVLWEYLKNMFEEPLSTDSIWSLPGQQRIICWRYYDACRVHCLNLESVDVYMLIERKYPLSAEVCQAMLDKKLQGGKPDEDCYKLLKMMEKQAGIRKYCKELASPQVYGLW
ncbi:hypothetical protein Tco_1383945, partial [Tanacetum coccineum]